MKKALLFASWLMMTTSTFGQDNLVFKSFKPDSISALMGVCPFFDNGKVYRNYCFYIDKKEDLMKVAASFEHGNKIKVDTMDNDLNIYVIKDKEVLPLQIGASPRY